MCPDTCIAFSCIVTPPSPLYPRGLILPCLAYFIKSVHLHTLPPLCHNFPLPIWPNSTHPPVCPTFKYLECTIMNSHLLLCVTTSLYSPLRSRVLILPQCTPLCPRVYTYSHFHPCVAPSPSPVNSNMLTPPPLCHTSPLHKVQSYTLTSTCVTPSLPSPVYSHILTLLPLCHTFPPLPKVQSYPHTSTPVSHLPYHPIPNVQLHTHPSTPVSHLPFPPQGTVIYSHLHACVTPTLLSPVYCHIFTPPPQCHIYPTIPSVQSHTHPSTPVSHLPFLPQVTYTPIPVIATDSAEEILC